MIKVNYGKNTYYVDDLLTEVYNFKMEKLSKRDYDSLSFTKEEFLNFLIEYHKKKNPITYHSNLSIREVICQNLMKEGIPLTIKMTEELVKGINYSIIKVKDRLATLSVLDKIKQKYGLEYFYCEFPLGPLKDKSKKKSVLKYITAPYGDHDKENFKTLPLLLPIVLSE